MLLLRIDVNDLPLNEHPIAVLIGDQLHIGVAITGESVSHRVFEVQGVGILEIDAGAIATAIEEGQGGVFTGTIDGLYSSITWTLLHSERFTADWQN